jgi:hypothetical protein
MPSRHSVDIAVPIPDPGAGRGLMVDTMAQPLFSWESDPVPLVQEVQWSSGLVWMGPENLTFTGVSTWTIQPTARHYTSYAIVTTTHLYRCDKIRAF